MGVHGRPLVFVEDDALIRDLVMDILHDHGYQVLGAATAEDAMRRLAGAPAPLLAVTDIDLGGGRSGLEFADWLHERWPALHVIFASGRLDLLNGRAFHPRETRLGKPFSLVKLVERVRGFVPPPTASGP